MKSRESMQEVLFWIIYLLIGIVIWFFIMTLVPQDSQSLVLGVFTLCMLVLLVLFYSIRSYKKFKSKGWKQDAIEGVKSGMNSYDSEDSWILSLVVGLPLLLIGLIARAFSRTKR